MIENPQTTMLDIKKYYMYCMGEGYLDKRRYAEDSAATRFTQRVVQDNLDQSTRIQQRPTFQGQQNNLPLPFSPPAFVQQILQNILKPAQAVFEFFRNLFQAPQQPQQAQNANPFQMAGKPSESALGQIFSFFFGTKNDKAKEQKELEDREKDDFLAREEDVFGLKTVNSSNGSSMGGQK